MRTFMAVSQAMRDTLLLVCGMALFTLNALIMWLADAETLRRYKETHND